MANLLDYVAPAPRTPAAPRAPAPGKPRLLTPPLQPGGGPGFLDTLFGGATPQVGGPDVTERAQREALINAGVTLATHRGPGSLAAALDAGRAGYSAAATAAMQEAQAVRQQQVQQIIQQTLLQSANDPNALLATARRVLAAGDLEGAKAVLEMAKVEAAEKNGRKTQVVGDAKTGYKLIDMETGAPIATIFAPGAGQGRSPTELLEDTKKLSDEYRLTLQTQGFGDDPTYVRQLRDVTPAALAGTSEAQEAFFRALLRIQNPGIRRVSDDQVFAQAQQQGLLNGKLGVDLEQVAHGKLPGSVIQQWLPVVNSIIKGRMKGYDSLRNHFRSQALAVGLDPDAVAYDYFAWVRDTSVPGVDPDVAHRLNRTIEEEIQKRRANQQP